MRGRVDVFDHHIHLHFELRPMEIDCTVASSACTGAIGNGKRF